MKETVIGLEEYGPEGSRADESIRGEFNVESSNWRAMINLSFLPCQPAGNRLKEAATAVARTERKINACRAKAPVYLLIRLMER